MRTQKNPGLARNYSLSNASDNYCDVHVAEEQITLRFEREGDGIVRCTGHFKEHPDDPDRASRTAFTEARQLAIKQMNTLRGKKRVAGMAAQFEQPLVTDVTLAECVLSYRGNQYSYWCDVDKPLTWENLGCKGVFLGESGPRFLEPEEYIKLKKRAFGRLQEARRELYADDGLGLLKPNPQLSLAL